MLLTITTKRANASDLGYLLHKHPDKVQTFDMSAGKIHIFYPIAQADCCSVCLLMDIDPVEFARKNKGNRSALSLDHYVNDRPYAASSFLSVAISKAFNTAMNGHCQQMPHLVDEVMPFEVNISVLPARRGGAPLIKSLFEPLGYEVTTTQHQLDEEFPEWGQSRYYNVGLVGQQKLKHLLSHLYVLIPVLDAEKHYWVSESEVEKLLDKGKEWLASHPESTQITRRYLKNIRPLTRLTVERLEEDRVNDTTESHDPEKEKARVSLHQKRLEAATLELVSSGAKSVVDLGCGEGKLLKLLLKERQFTNILGMDVAHKALSRASDFLKFDRMSSIQRDRIKLIHGSLTYKDDRLKGYEAAAIIEVIEHLDEDRLPSFAKAVFGHAKPGLVVLTTPNSTYNQLYENMKENSMRHDDHRFEWTQEEFADWVKGICEQYAYEAVIKAVGDVHETYGPPSQMAVFQKEDQNVPS